MNLVVNGAARDVPAEATVAELMAMLGHGREPRGVAVAVNGAVVSRGEWTTTSVRAGDRVEVLGAAQGG